MLTTKPSMKFEEKSRKKDNVIDQERIKVSDLTSFFFKYPTPYKTRTSF